MLFRDRTEAGQYLAEKLASYADRPDLLILALPRGGVPVAAEIAAALHAPLDLVLVRKIGVPFQPELAMGAVVDGGTPLVVRNEDVMRLAGMAEPQFTAVCENELDELQRRRERYLGGRPRAAVAGHTVIVVDDGVATGATARAALRATRMRRPKTLVLAVPVAPTANLTALHSEADEVVCLEDYADFDAIGIYYADFRQVADDEVTRLLGLFPPAVAYATAPADQTTA